MQDVTIAQRLIQDCHAVVVDEAPMLNKAEFEALDRTLKDIMSTNEIMGEFQLCYLKMLGKYFL